MARILVVAPNSDFRHSLQFALESEGYEVTATESLANSATTEAEVTVIDHHALGKDQDAAIAFVTAHQPVVLLANARAHALSPWAFRTVMKPMLGDSLSGAVRQAIETGAH